MMKFVLPKLRDILFIAIFTGVFLAGQRSLNIDGDLGRHITLGQFIIKHKTIPSSDLFSHTMPGKPLTPHEWLAEVIYTVFYRFLSLDGVVLLEALLIALTIAWIYSDSYDRGKSYALATLFSIWAAAMSSIHWLPRPHLFTFLLLAIWTTEIRKIATGIKFSIWLVPLLMIIWVNTHGAFISGFVVLGCYLIGTIIEHRDNGNNAIQKKTQKRLVIAGGLALVATLFNPASWKIWQTSIGYVTNTYLTSHTMEYLSPDFHLAGFWPFLGMIGFIILFFSRSWGKLSISEGLLIASWAIMGLVSARNIPLFAIIAVPILAAYFAHFASNNRFILTFDRAIANTDRQLFGTIWPLAVMVVFVFSILYRGENRFLNANRNYSFDPTAFPVEAVNWLERNPQDGNMFNYFTWGGYLLYRLWPSQPVFIDGQTDFYGEELTREYASSISGDPLWNEVFKKYQIQWAIIPKGVPLKGELVSAGWETLYEDETAILLRMP
jgi:hypothetical protein